MRLPRTSTPLALLALLTTGACAPEAPAAPEDRARAAAPSPRGDAHGSELCLIPACEHLDPSQPGLIPRQPYAETSLRLPPLRGTQGQPLTWQMSVKFVDGAQVRVDGQAPRSLTGRDLAALETLTAQYDLEFSPALTLVGSEIADLEARARARSGRAQPDLAGLAIVELPAPQGEQWRDIGQRLQALEIVEFVEIQAALTPPPADIDPATPELTEFQGYLGPDPGIDVQAAWALNLRGQGMRLADVEYAWNTDHEDLVDQGVTPEPLQTLSMEALENVDHGTSVIGITSAGNNGYGITGTVSQAALFTFPELTVEGGPRRVQAIAAAAANSNPGDVVMLELQVGGASGGEDDYVPAEFAPGVHMVTRTATDAGVIVVAAAGNGDEDLDAPEYAEYMAREDSGALIVGAGSSTLAHSKMSFSTYGSRVNIQGWGTNVFTLGGGSFASYGDDYNQAYTGGFNGTSSAVPVVSSAVVLIGQFAKERGVELNAFGLRDLLIKTAIPTNADHLIGPFPNIANAIQALEVEDVGPPTVAITAPGPGPELWIPEDTFETDIVIEASDETFVSQVTIEIAGQEQPWVGLTPPYTIQGVNFVSGDWELRARAEDVWGNVGESTQLTLHIGQEPPSDTGAEDEAGTEDETGGTSGGEAGAAGESGGCSVAAPDDRPRPCFALTLLAVFGLALRRRRRAQ